MATGKGKSWHPTQTTAKWIPVGKLNPLNFRPLTAPKVSKFVREMDPDAIGTLYISQRKDGSYWVIDGNHRREAVHRLWGPEAQVPCQIYTNLSLAREAELFVEYNDEATKPPPIYRFLAKLQYNEQSQAIADIVAGKHGLEITAAAGMARIMAVQSLETVYAKAGADALDTTLTVVSDAWGKHSSSFQTQVIHGVGVIFARFPEVDAARLTKVLSETTPKRLVARAEEARCSEFETRTQDTKSGSFVARLILAGYNKRLRADKVLTWIDQPSRYYWTPAAEYSRILLQKMSEQQEAE